MTRVPRSVEKATLSKHSAFPAAFRYGSAQIQPCSSFAEYSPHTTFWCRDYVIFASPFPMRQLLCITHCDLLLICPRRSCRTAPLSQQIKRSAYNIRITISFWAPLPGWGFYHKRRAARVPATLFSCDGNKPIPSSLMLFSSGQIPQRLIHGRKQLSHISVQLRSECRVDAKPCGRSAPHDAFALLHQRLQLLILKNVPIVEIR